METLKRRYLNILRTVNLDFVRDVINKINWNDRLIAIRGQRGVGKTTLMLQKIQQTFGMNDTENVLYASLDNIYFTNHSLLETIDSFHLHGGKFLFLDEVHKYANWSREIKNAYDEYPDMHIVISGSSLLNILDSETDLSRRCIFYDIQGLSFREYLHMFHDYDFEMLTLQDITGKGQEACDSITEKIHPLKYFDTYLKYGYYPFFKEGEESYYQRIENVTNTIIDIELPQLRGVDIVNLRKLKSLLSILASGMTMQIDTVKLSKMAEISRNTLLQYLQHLHDSRLLHLLYSDNGSVKRLQKPDKVYMDNSNILYALSSDGVNIGTVRETFFVNQLAYEHNVEYSSSKADFLIDKKYTFEVGGKNKDGGQLPKEKNSFIASDDTEYVLGNKIPLWLFGFLY